MEKKKAKKIEEATSSYIIRDIPQDLWDQVRHRAIDERLNLKELVIKALRFYLEN